MRVSHTIPYQGSKRSLAHQILRFFPDDCNRLIEPFAGSAAISVAAAFYNKTNHFILNDINKPLVHLLEMIISNPQAIIQHYYNTWHRQLGKEEHYYNWIRSRFNTTQQPEDLLFLLSKCVKSAIRYNAKGHFNQSLDKRLPGRNPQLMQSDLLHISQLLKGKTRCYVYDYQQLLPMATATDLVYLDPPYQGTGITGGFNYAGNIRLHEFIQALSQLNKKNISYILSFNGRTGSKVFGTPLPADLELTKIEINSGRSSQATLLRRTDITYESLYLSPALCARIDLGTILEQHSGSQIQHLGKKRKHHHIRLVTTCKKQ